MALPRLIRDDAEREWMYDLHLRNAPRIRIDGRRIAVNGLYRHGFLLAPALAELTVAYVCDGTTDDEVTE